MNLKRAKYFDVTELAMGQHEGKMNVDGTILIINVGSGEAKVQVEGQGTILSVKPQERVGVRDKEIWIAKRGEAAGQVASDFSINAGEKVGKGVGAVANVIARGGGFLRLFR